MEKNEKMTEAEIKGIKEILNNQLFAGTVGCILGSILTYVSNWKNNKDKIKQLREDFSKEMESNLVEIERLRNLVDSLEKRIHERDQTVFKENIHIKCVYWCFQYMVSQGKIYECINSEIYYLLDNVYRDLSQIGENNANNEFQNLEAVLCSPDPNIYEDPVAAKWHQVQIQANKLFIDWRKKLSQHKEELEKIKIILKKL